MINLYLNIKHFLLNLIKYRKFLWTDRWWDNYYIFHMLREKLKNDLKMYKKYCLNAHPENIISSMELCVMLLNRIIKDEYLTNALYFYEKKYPDWMSCMSIDDEGLFHSSIPEREWFRRCSNRADLQKKQDVKYLFEVLGKHSLTWWD